MDHWLFTLNALDNEWKGWTTTAATATKTASFSILSISQFSQANSFIFYSRFWDKLHSNFIFVIFFIYIFKPFSSFPFNHVTKICKTRIILINPFTAQDLWFKKKNKETFLRKKIPQAWVLNKISHCCLHSIHASSRRIFVMNLDTTTSNQCMKIWLFSPSWAW